jgi:hypothetical protein
VYLETLGSVKEIWEVEVGNVVSGDDIWINFLEEISPGSEHLLFPVKLKNLSCHNRASLIETEDIAHEWLLFSVSGDDVGNLDNRIMFCLGEDALAARALNIERQDSERSHLGPFIDRFMSDQVSIADLGFDLTVGLLIVDVNQLIFARRSFNPTHARDLSSVSWLNRDNR